MKELACILAVLLVCAARAELLPQSLEKADVVVGMVTKLATAEEKFGGDGAKTTYTATVKVDKVEKDVAKFWLMKNKDGYSVIYNTNGVEKVKE